MCGVSAKYLCSVLSPRPATSCVAPQHTTLVLFLSALPPNQPSSTETGSVRAQTAQGLLGLAPGLRQKCQPCLLRLGQSVPEAAGVLFCTFCLGSGTAGVSGELQFPALPEAPIHCHSPPFWFILCKARLQLQALKPGCCRYCSCATPCRCSD